MDLAANTDGSFVVAWTTYPLEYGGPHTVLGQRVGAQGAPLGTEFIVNTTDYAPTQEVQLDTDAEGNFVVVWSAGNFDGSGPDGAYFGIFGQRFASNGTRAGTEFQVNTFTTYSESRPDVAMASGGSFVVVWETQYGDEFANPFFPDNGFPTSLDHSVTMRRYNAAGTPLEDDEEHINTYVPGNQARPTIAMNTNGSFVVAWESASAYYSASHDNRDDGAGVWARCFNPDGTGSESEFHINTYTPGAEGNLSLATNGSGDFVAAWTRSDGGYYGSSIGAHGRQFTVSDCPSDGTGTTTTTLPGGGGGTLTVTKNDGGHAWTEDPTIQYVINVTAVGGTVTDIVLTETVPEMTTFNASESSAWTCTPDASAGSTCTIDRGTLNDGNLRQSIFSVDVVEDIPAYWDVYNEVEATGTGAASLSAGIISPLTFFGSDITTPATEAACEADVAACWANCIWCYMIYTFTADPNACEAFDFSQSIRAGLARAAGTAEAPTPAKLSTGSITTALYTLRDRVLNQSRGGQRAIELYYEHSPAIVTAAIADGTIITQGLAAVAAFEQNARDLAAGSGTTAMVTQNQIDTLNSFLDTLRAQASGDLADAIDRERARMDLDDLVGGSMDDAFAELDTLSCDGFETTLFCGEVTGDCTITATDALRVLRIAVGSSDPLAEADVDGSGATTASDALIVLNVAVGLIAPPTACNVQ